MYLMDVNEHINLHYSKAVLPRNSITHLNVLCSFSSDSSLLNTRLFTCLWKHFQTNPVNPDYGSLSSMISLIKQVANQVNQNAQLF